jgi:hypothetical protein
VRISLSCGWQVANSQIFVPSIVFELGENPDLTSESMEKALTKLEAKLKSEPKNKTVKKEVRQLRKDFVPRKRKYETQLQILGERNSFSKTDPDATFTLWRECLMYE